MQEALQIAQESGDFTQGGRFTTLGYTCYALGLPERAVTFYQEALEQAREIDDHTGEAYVLMRLGQVWLVQGELEKAVECCVKAMALEIPHNSYRAATVLGIVHLQQGNPAAGERFAEAVRRSREILDRVGSVYRARYSLATALLGCAVCSADWTDPGEQDRLFRPNSNGHHTPVGSRWSWAMGRHCVTVATASPCARA